MTVSENCAVISNKSVSIDGNLITFSSEKIAHSALPGSLWKSRARTGECS